MIPGRDLARAQLGACMQSSPIVIAEVLASLNHKVVLMYAQCAFVHCYMREEMEEGDCLMPQ